jgi:predicted NAD/FAD-dependent oxidoreductase
MIPGPTSGIMMKVTSETSRGMPRARACLVTVSTGALNAGKIRFTPALPARKVLAEPLAERLCFAGDAMGGCTSALVDGAFKSGKSSAKAIARALA